MQPGRELDKLVAEALGYEVVVRGSDYDFVKSGMYCCGLPHFSTTGDGMLRLIEEARKQGYIVTLSAQDVGYYCGFDHYGVHVVGDGETAPKAVSLAFLKAKGVDITPYLKCGRCDGSGYLDHGEGPLGGAEPCGCGGNGR